MKLTGKAAIITGGTSGIGEAVAMLFAQEGAQLTIAGRTDKGETVAKAIRNAGGRVQFVPTDVSRTEDVVALVDAHVSAYGRLDVLVNNAAYDGSHSSITNTPESELDELFATNVKSVFTACKLAAPIMIEAGAGSIVNTTATAAHEGFGLPNLAAYTASKGAVIAFGRALAAELSPKGVRVNSISPGIIDTPMLRRFLANRRDGDATRRRLEGMQLLRRLGTSEEFARGVLFLASEDSSYVTGTELLVDGGLVLA
jgi:NAD(P)-dependent dehydrogenase (short-subunit alcohol dehydrogenase family)